MCCEEHFTQSRIRGPFTSARWEALASCLAFGCETGTFSGDGTGVGAVGDAEIDSCENSSSIRRRPSTVTLEEIVGGENVTSAITG